MSHLLHHPVVIKAKYFATMAHGEQRRKYTEQPYIVHPIEVAMIVATVPHDFEMLAACILHDVVEDTFVTLDMVVHRFGNDIGNLVEQLSDVSRPEDGNRAARKALDFEHTAASCPRAKTANLGDIISNSKSIIVYDPDFSVVFMREMRLLLEVLEEGDSSLYDEASQIVEAYYDSR